MDRGFYYVNCMGSLAKLSAEPVSANLSHWIESGWPRLDQGERWGRERETPAAASGGGTMAGHREMSPEFINSTTPGIIGRGVCTGGESG